MAKLSLVYGVRCFVCLLITSAITCYSLNDYHFYDIGNSKLFESIQFSPYDDEQSNHRFVKREASPVTTPKDGIIIQPNVDNKTALLLEMSTTALPEHEVIKSTTTATTKLLSMTLPTTAVQTTSSDTNNNKDDYISINKFPDGLNNKTLEDHNITSTRNDSHIYYNSSFKTDEASGRQFWVNVDKHESMKVSDLLSKSHRRAATVRLSFEFPFYGHYIRNVTIATGGFLYTGDYVHSWLAATQYIAPLMANFDTSLSNDSFIKYCDNGTAFTVVWENVSLQDNPNDGKFTFQATLHSSGDIVFVYQNVPVIIEKIQDNHHPVKVGLSDAYIIDRTIFFVRRKTIYEYHRVNFRKEDIGNWTVIYLTALPTCPGMKDCSTCLTNDLANFQCFWCPSINKCSNGLDRNRQDWLTKGCEKRQIKNETECSLVFPAEPFDDHELQYSHEQNYDTSEEMRASSRISHDSSVLPATRPVRMSMSSIIAMLFIMTFISGMVLWIFYAYRNPHTTSGQILIRYRPSQWSWRRGEARYTAATIHM